MKALLNLTTLILLAAFSAPVVQAQTGVNPNEPKTDEEVRNRETSNTHSVNYKKPLIKVPAVIAPAAATTGSASCADQLGKGNSGYTACEAGQRNR